MSESSKKATLVKMLSKKEVKKVVFEKLSGALAEYKNNFGKKEFETKLKKASKLFAVDIAKRVKKEKKPAVPKKEAEQK
jgi:hypothetical protein